MEPKDILGRSLSQGVSQGWDQGGGQSGSQAGPGDGKPALPSVSLPKGGGAIRGLGEKFAANPVSGTASLTVPVATSPGRSEFGPKLSLAYDSGSGNGPFGFGWSLSLPAIARKTDKGLPQYRDREESDVYILSGGEDLVPVLRPDGTPFEDPTTAPGYVIHRYRPRVEGAFARIERWVNTTTGAVHWRSISRENVTTMYGKDDGSRIFDPATPARVFSWLISESYDDKGNAMVYEYAPENDANVDASRASERSRGRTANRYLKRIKYGNRVSRLVQPDLAAAEWLFEVVFDYDEGHYEEIPLDPGRPEAEQHRYVRASADCPSAGTSWAVRPDPFSSYRAGFEVRAYRRCRRILMFHHIPDLPTGEKGYDGLVRSTEFDYADLHYGAPVAIEDELAHQGSTRFASFIQAAWQSGYVRDEAQPVAVRDGVEYPAYLKKTLPPLEFEYSKAVVQDTVRVLDPESLENLPAGVDGTAYQWVDLNGEGVQGILSEQAGAWFYKPSLGEGRFGPLETVPARPSPGLSGGGRGQLLDLAGDGQLDLAVFAGLTPGFFERTPDEGWEPFRPFESLPNLAWNDPNLRFVDLDGDGHADILVTEADVFTWHPSLAEEGFGPARKVRQAPDEERGPRLVLADGTQSIYLADMGGDGLTDLVRVRNGEVCYWPSLGYGRFGAKVTLDNSPVLDPPDQLDQRRVRLADIDGSGTTDLIYLAADGVRLYFNQSGNRLSEAYRLPPLPHLDNVSSVAPGDLLGNGTACLVWSSPLPADQGRSLRYIDLMGGQKPHLLTRSVNNLGAETRVEYAASTRFYLEDKRQGRPWVTRLPFPVHVVERVQTWDRVSGNRFVTRYAYHHGYFDGVEREFRGFGLTEQWDTEEFAALNPGGLVPSGSNVEASSHVPPVLTRSWFHTGVYLGRQHVSDFFAGLLDASDAGEYYREPGLTDAEARALLLEDTVLPAGLTLEEEREACRALKGSMLRQEVYALDGSVDEGHPYSVTEQNFTLRTLQRRGANRHAVFLVHSRETITLYYERHPEDPRTKHDLTLEVDDYGNVLMSAAITYGRRQADPSLDAADQARQAATLLTYTENAFTNPVDGADNHRVPQPSESRTYELTGLTLPAGQSRFGLQDILDAAAAATAIAYEEAPSPGALEKRLIEHLRTLYRRDDLAGALALGALQPLALPFENYKLAFTPSLLAQVYAGRVDDAMLRDEAAYVHSEGDSNWWLPSGRVYYSPGSGDSPAQELAHARQGFFLTRRHHDPFHTPAVSTEGFVTYDAFDLLVEETRDALGNRVTAGERNLDPTLVLVRRCPDYRVLQPTMVMDPNRNRSEVAFDALGLVAGNAMMGKPEEVPAPGDRLGPAFHGDLTRAEIDGLVADPRGPLAAGLLGDATSRVVSDLSAYYREPDPGKKPPAVSVTLNRETHASELPPAGGLRVQVSLTYCDGFGREIQKKIQAEAGRAPARDGAGKITVGPDGQPEMTSSDVSPRWVGSGWKVHNNKGKAVRQYEPFFTDTHRFEFEPRIGVSPVLCYDPAGRVVATLHPDHTWEKAVFDPWRQESWDASDCVLVSDSASDAHVGGHFRRLAAAEYLPTWYALRTDPAHASEGSLRWPDPRTREAEAGAAGKAAIHAWSPSVTQADSLGRTFLTVVHNKYKYGDAAPSDPPLEEFYLSRVVLDVEGNQREVVDAQGRTVMRYDYDMLGNRVHQASMEAGERWMLNDVAGNPLSTWDSRSHRLRRRYDRLRRPTETLLCVAVGPEMVVGRTIYGESQPSPEAHNLRGKMVQAFDQAGVVTADDYDFKGNLRGSSRRVAARVGSGPGAVPAYTTTLDWSGSVELEAESYISRTRYDALNRPIQTVAPHSNQPGAQINVIQPGYNDANLLERLNVWLGESAEPAAWLDPATATLRAVTDVDYDAKGQRRSIGFGNGARTTGEYDPLTYKLVCLRTTRASPAYPEDCPDPAPAGWPGCQVQNLHYTYDPAGNVTHIRDDAQQTVFFRNRRVEPSADYTYDAAYRLIEATGREHLGAGGAPAAHGYDDFPRFGLAHPGDGNAMGTYVERYVYDAVGNFLETRHRGADPAHPGWTRAYAYEEPSQLEPGRRSNRLTSTTLGGTTPTTETYSTAGDGYDAHGGMLRLPHLGALEWDFKDQLRMTRRQAMGASDEDGLEHEGERTWYVYDAAGQRVRKVTVLASGELKDERLYLGGLEVYRRHSGPTAGLVRESLHVMEGKRRVALAETRVAGSETGVPAQLVRYQFGNHIGSASLELDNAARLVSYEEYAPFGSTTYEAASGLTEAPKRYRFTGKERDEESGFYYQGARYYAPWLGRWTTADPAGLADGDDLYRYARNNPVSFTDPSGTETGSQVPYRRSEYRLHFDNPVTDPETHASYFNLMVGGLNYADTQLGRVRSHWSLRLAEFLASGVLLYGPMVASHELGGHVGAAQHYGLEARVTDFNWFTGMSRWEGYATETQALAIHAAGANQQTRNAEEIWRRMARFGFGPQDAIAYCLNSGGLTAYSLITIASSNPSATNDIANYTAGGWTWSPRDLFIAGAWSMIPAISTLLYTGVNFVGYNERRFELPSVGIGGARLTLPQTQVVLTSQGPVLGARSMLRPGGRWPDFELTTDVRPTSDAAVAVGVRVHGITIPGVSWLELGASSRVTIGRTSGFQGDVEATFQPSPASPLGINLSVGGATTGDLLAEPERRSGFQLGLGLELRY